MNNSEDIPKDYVASAFRMFDVMIKAMKITADVHKEDEEFLTKMLTYMMNGDFMKASQMKFLLSEEQWKILPECITSFLEQYTNQSFAEHE